MDDQNRQKSMSMKMGYGRFAAMVATSTVVMFILMYQATYLLAHVEYSQSRMWMAIVMGATMGILMLGFMWSMYKSMKINLAVLAACEVGRDSCRARVCRYVEIWGVAVPVNK